MGYLLHRRRSSGGVVNTSWATWDEVTQDGWGDSANTFICLFDAPNLADHEIGLGGGLSEVNRTVYQVNNVPGAVGSPPYRQLTAAPQQWFEFSRAASYVALGNVYTSLAKIKDLTVSNDVVIAQESGGTAQCVYLTGGKVRSLITGVHDKTTTNSYPTTGDVYFFQCCNGTNTVAGFSTTKPTTLTGLTAGDYVQTAGSHVQMDLINYHHLFYDNGGAWATVKLYYLILSKSCLISL